jgi:hypothetical protein
MGVEFDADTDCLLECLSHTTLRFDETSYVVPRLGVVVHVYQSDAKAAEEAEVISNDELSGR